MGVPFIARAVQAARGLASRSVAARGAGGLAGIAIGNQSLPNANPPTPVPDIDVQDAVRKFNRGLREYAKVSSSSLPKIINRRMVFVAKRAYEGTPKASRSKIESELGVVAYRVIKSRKTGQLKKGTFVVQGTRGENIIQGLRVKRGEKPLTQKEVRKEARKLIGSRLRAVGALRHGWSDGIRPFQRASGYFVNIERGRIRTKSKGYPATPGRFNPRAKLIYRITINRGGKRIIHPQVARATAMAFRAETRSMGKEVSRRLSQDWSKKRYFK